jgi:hypothetical protein
VPPGRSAKPPAFPVGRGQAALAACPGLACAGESGVHPLCPAGGPVASPGAGRLGRAGALMTWAVGESVTLAGLAERAWAARAFVEAV